MAKWLGIVAALACGSFGEVAMAQEPPPPPVEAPPVEAPPVEAPPTFVSAPTPPPPSVPANATPPTGFQYVKYRRPSWVPLGVGLGMFGMT